MQPSSVLALPHIDLQADFSIHLADLEPVVVLQGKQGVQDVYKRQLPSEIVPPKMTTSDPWEIKVAEEIGRASCRERV